MVPTDTTINSDNVLLLIVQVQTNHLSSGKSLTATTETATATTEAHIVDVVGTGHQEGFEVIFHHTTEDTAAITVLSTGCQVCIDHDTFVHTCLDAEVENRFLFTIINTADTRQITLLVVGTYTLDDRGGQILHGSLCITGHELLAIHHNLLNLFTIDGYLTVVINLGSWKALHQFLNNGTLGCTISRGIIYKGVCLDNDL